jgi:DNA-directed RNA polymerase subunit RPC12/RpoP
MKGSGRVVGLLLIGAGVVLGVAIGAWLIAGLQDDKIDTAAAIFGLVLALGVIVLPMVGFGIYFLISGTREAKTISELEKQRKLLSIVQAKGQIQISDLVFELNSTRDEIQDDLYDLVGKGIFSGYIDWNSGILYSVEAKELQGRQTCPNCGGKLELAGKGLIKCPYCGAEIFLS